jgi:hypothetical protein
MNEFRNGTLDGFSAVSIDEMDQIEGGGQASASWVDPRTVGTIVESFVREATARYRALKEQYG